jgi:Homeodomain-like domain
VGVFDGVQAGAGVVADPLGHRNLAIVVERSSTTRWHRFVEDRLKGLTEEPRPGAPRKISDEQREVVVATVERQPAGAMRRSRTSVANESELSNQWFPGSGRRSGSNPTGAFSGGSR